MAGLHHRTSAAAYSGLSGAGPEIERLNPPLHEGEGQRDLVNLGFFIKQIMLKSSCATRGNEKGGMGKRGEKKQDRQEKWLPEDH